MHTINGNILDMKPGMIVHQVNCRRVAVAGLTAQIAAKWPEWRVAFLNREPMPGHAAFYYVTLKTFQDRPNLLVIPDLYSQDRYGRPMSNQYTRYGWLATALQDAREHAEKVGIQSIYIPYMIGCRLGGGDWNIVEQIIEDCVPNATLVRLPERY